MREASSSTVLPATPAGTITQAARAWQLRDEIVERCGTLNAPTHDLLNGGGVHVIDDVLMPILRQALH